VSKIAVYNFLPVWAPLVKSGMKPHTIRRRRKNPTEKGDWLKHFVGLRTKACELLYEQECAAVTPIEFLEVDGKPGVTLDAGALYYGVRWDKSLKLGQGPGWTLQQMAEWDGFPTPDAFLKFFVDHYGMPSKDLELVEWRTPERAAHARW